MSTHNTLTVTAVTILLLATTMAVIRWEFSRQQRKPSRDVPLEHKELLQPSKIALDLKTTIPDAVTLSTESDEFNKIIESYWAKQSRELFPSCFVRPRSVEQLQKAIKLLKQEYLENMVGKGQYKGIFTVKAGAASPGLGFNNLDGGVVVDLALFRDITYADDNSQVTVGAGLKWKDLYEDLATRSLAVAGGRTVPVGVAGLTLQGGMSFFSPMHGFVCSTVTSYSVVLADGTAVVASEASYPDLWRALKGGSNNFGIVTSFTIPCFPSNDIWFTCNYMSGFQAPGLVKAFYLYVKDTTSGKPGAFDEHAMIPITAFGYTRDFGVHATANYLGYTAPPADNKWPSHWKNSPFGSLWDLWSTAKVQPMLSAVKELSEPSPPGSYNVFAVTTVKNDLDTLMAAHTAYRSCSAAGKRIKGMVLSLVFQPILPQWMNNGHPNVLGLDDCTEPLVVVEITVKWERNEDSELARSQARRFIKEVDSYAETNQTAHPFRFTNYCAEWQDPMKGYGEENVEFMRSVSRKYDPEGLFQRGCLGGFKLGMDDSSKM